MICKICEDEFDPTSAMKRRVGGRINECPECSEEPTPRYLGVQNGDGKQAGITVLAFHSLSDRETYQRFWQNNSGLHKGKSCQLGSHTTPDPGVGFRTVTQTTATNHKGKL